MNEAQLEAARAALIRRGAYERAARLGLLSLGLSAAFRGASGLANSVVRNFRPARRPSLLSPVTIEVPVHGEEEEEEKKASDDIASFFAGGKNTRPEGWWASLPLTVGAVGTGLIGGWTLADKLLDRRRKQQLKAELAKAKEEYEAALRGESKLGRQLDALYDTLEKRAVSAVDYGGRALGVLAALGLLSGATGAYVGYRTTRKRSPYGIKEKAKKRLRLERLRRRPSPIYAQPIPVHDALEDEELKAAAAAPPPSPPQVPRPPRGPSVPPSPPRPR